MGRKLKILAVIECLDDCYGGPANTLPSLLRELENHYNVKTKIFSLRNYQTETNQLVQKTNLHWDNSCLIFGPEKIKYSPTLRQKLNQEIDSNTVVYINNLWNYVSFIAFKIAKNNGAKVVIAPRGSLYPWSLGQRQFVKNIALKLFQLKQLKEADLIHTTCQSEFDAVASLGVEKQRIFISQHGIDMPDHELTASTGKSHTSELLKKPYVLFMSRLHKKKGLDILLDMWKKNHHLFPNYNLLIAGPDYDNYQQTIRNVHAAYYVGTVQGEEKRSLLANAEFFALPSHTENFGVVIGESLAHGTPVLTTTNTPWQIINDKNAGRCVELSNFKQEFIEMIKLPPSSLETMSNNAPKLIQESYSWKERAKDFMKAIAHILPTPTS